MTITKKQIEAIAHDLMSGKNKMNRDLISEGWTFGWSTRRAALGDCSYRDKHIRLSSVYLNARTIDEQINTITHEMAHAIAYTDFNQRGHNAVWKRIHRKLGGDGQRCSKVSNPEAAVDAKYTVFFINDNQEIEVIETTNRLIKRFQPGNIENLYLRNRKAETKGKLRCVATATFKAIKADLEASKSNEAEPAPVAAPKKEKAPKKVNARGAEARKQIAEKAVATLGFANVDFEQRGKYKDWYITATVNGEKFEQRLDSFKKKNNF